METTKIKIYVATTNTGKLKEFREVLNGSGIDIESVDLKFDELQNDDIEKISKDKAIQAFSRLRSPVLVDDVGIYIDKYKNFPGINAKQVVESLSLYGIKRLIDEGDRAHFLIAISYMDSSLNEPQTFFGKTEGKLSLNYRGEGERDFPFNQLFIPDGESKFVCEIPVEERKRFSHRMKAAIDFKMYILQKNAIVH
ncbi:MAG: hypothetical protein M1160_02125 [Candidatus Marsarchaeota archaeon]|jgi:non-canonical purine NTP pyrophosphatase (RdgB/HAM1 family)|nr:hypothetical protein [Candidatus Marsarchaeota archaeon]MCL5111658.1 hypothetical protein [Candidatus Marsarchaeota archaeon]